MTTDGVKYFYLGQIKYQVYAKIESVTVLAKSYVETNSQTLVTVHVLPKLKKMDCEIYLSIIDENGQTIFKTKYVNSLFYIFEVSGVYKVVASVITPHIKLTNVKLITAQDPIVDVDVISPKPLEHVMVHTDIHFFVKVIGNNDINCLWKIQCIHTTMWKTFEYETRIESCKSSKRFGSLSTCSVTVTVFNNVSKLELQDKFKIFVEEPVSILETYTPSIARLNSEVDVIVCVKNILQNIVVDINTSSTHLKVVYDHKVSSYKARVSFEKLGVETIRFKVSNNVSTVILRKKTNVIEAVGRVEIINAGCTAAGFPLRVLVLVNGKCFEP